MNTPTVAQCNTFYEQIKKCELLDLRDNRGKKHCLALVLLSVIIALYRNRDGVLSSIHRSMQNTHIELCSYLQIEYVRPVSRAQLPLILKKIDVKIFSDLQFSFFGKALSENKKKWFAGDGKELRGSIAKGEKRGDAVVQVVSHETRNVHSQAFYNGKKESEIPCVRQLLDGELCTQKISLDALHLNPETTSMIEKKEGHYLIGLKENQKELYDDMSKLSKQKISIKSHQEVEKGHGRVNKWEYENYAINEEYFDERWSESNFQTLIKVERTSFECKTNKESVETSYYLSNLKASDEKEQELFNAVRNHWRVETNNYVRDITFKEDNLKTKESVISKVLACGRTLAINLLNTLKLSNIRAKIEAFADDFQALMLWMTEMKIL